ncbi:MAG: hypothetical protein S4CHLAM102_15100 [Chlamydiia bacterium]|nr:hypothetical protein [Chlamydiia bacterium]
MKKTYRGIPKAKGGIGLNIIGQDRRLFKINYFKKRFFLPEENRWVTLRLSAHGMRIIDKIGISKAVKKLRAEGTKI